MIYIFNEDLKIIDILRKYNFLQYNNKFRDIGTFKINAQLVEENLYLLDETKQYYVLFDFDEYVFGQVTKIKQIGDGDNDKEIVIDGKLSKYILTKRVINGTINYKGKTFGLVKEIIDSNVVSSSNEKRNLPIEIVCDEEYLASACSDITKQITGGYVWEEVEKLLMQDNLGIDFVPNVINDSNITNINKWYLTINVGVDRTKTNKYGNSPVVFSQQLSNIASVYYERNVEEYTDCAYVAGEGEEENRKWYEVNRTDKDNYGWNRKELWIDARDIQSESEDGTILSETEYEKLIKERANEKFSESDVQESYEATLTENNAQYTYGIDYKLGDWCTITDINLNKELDVQITEIIVTVQGTRKTIDVGFTYGLIKKDAIKQIQQNTNEIQRISNNIKYVENKIGKMNKGINLISDYIVEQDVVDNWYYRKWNSGIIELYGYVSNVSSGTDLVEAKYEFPINIVSLISVNVSQVYNAWAIDRCYLNQQDGMVDIENIRLVYIANEGTERAYEFSIQIIARYK